MCSMGFAPKTGGELAPYAFTPRLPERSNLAEEKYGAEIRTAEDFRDSVDQDSRI